MPLKLRSLDQGNKPELVNQRLISLINSMADAVIAADENINIAQYNSSALNILDVNNIAIGTPLAQVFRPLNKNSQPIDISDMIRKTSRATTNRDLRLGYKDGSYISIFLSIAPVHLGFHVQGDKGYVMLIRDITREKSLEEERDEFISVVSHELRTPITIAEGNLSNAALIASKSGDLQKIKSAIEESHEQVLFLAEMINDLATLSRAERGTLTVEVSEIKVSELINDLIRSYSAEAKNKGLELKDVINPEVSILRSSRLYVREILQNFITNALKYTDKGEVVIHAEPAEGGIYLSVHDSGIGISKADQERVFDKFYRSENYRTRRANGTGLGLYVTLKLARLINASLYLQSELSHGSTFSIFIPNQKASSKSEADSEVNIHSDPSK